MLARREKQFKLGPPDLEEANMATHSQTLKTRRKNQKNRKRLARTAKLAKKLAKRNARGASR
jgi:hypothetical protein